MRMQAAASPAVPTTVRILVVDDNVAFRDSLAALLEGDDLTVVGQAGSGAEALELVRTLSPDVVLMDVRMPEMDGIETTRRLKALRPSVGVVALTGLEEQRAVRDMLVAGACGYVLKDSDGDDIVRAIQKAASGGAMLSPEITPTVIEELTEALERERRRTRQLELAQEALLERAARRQQLIGRLGHELRTPVTVIMGLAQTLQRAPMQGEELTEYLAALVERAEGLARLVHRFEAAVEAGLTEWADVVALAREAAELDPRIRVEAPDTPMMTTLNRTAGLRIVEELVENALAFSPDGAEVLVRVTLAGDRPEVRVIDRGPGVAPDDVERIFEPLEQAEDLYTRTHQGVGLGLSLARLSARAMDGDVVLETSGPTGATFLWTVSGAPAASPEPGLT
ncbi:MAG TPA: response regulator [Actinomycetota bacterium]|jgi:signal transduction histidine kinase